MLSLRIDGAMRRFRADLDGDVVQVHDGRARLALRIDRGARGSGGDEGGGDHRIRAPMPGRVVLVPGRPGQAVKAGEVVLVLEAMKMELALKAPRDGVLAEVRAAPGDFVDADTVLAVLEA